MGAVKGGKSDPKMGKLTEKLKADFEGAMDDDLNVSLALSHVFDFIRTVNKTVSLGKKDAEGIRETILDLDRVLGLGLEAAGTAWQGLVEAPETVRKLIEKREESRKGKDWKEADRIRDMLKKQGILLEDTKEGVKWRRER
jgi:cysteinyl-tRNA synthetase